jgi:GT2 family glycosyltransferase
MSKVKNLGFKKPPLSSLFRVSGIVCRYLLSWAGFKVFGVPKDYAKQISTNLNLHKLDFPSVSIVIPTRDRVELLRKSVTAVQSQAGHKNFKILIINNDSVENATLEYFEELKSVDVTIMDCPGPFNFAKMHNDTLNANQSDFIFFLNNDAVALTSDWLSTLLRSASIDPKNSIVGVHQVDLRNKTNHDGVYVGKGGFVRQIGQAQKNGFRENHITQVQAVSFSACLVSGALFAKLGGFDESLAVGLNDVDFCLRAEGRGAKITLDSKVTFQHEVSATRGSILRLGNFKRAILETVYFADKWRL